MPSIDFASGLLGSYFDTVNAERNRQDKNKLDAADFLLRSGRLKDYNDLLPIIGDLGEPGISVKGGKGGKAKGAMSHHDLLGSLINPILQATQQQNGGAAGTAGVAPAPATSGAAPGTGGAPATNGAGAAGSVPVAGGRTSGPMFTEDEMVARGEAAKARDRAAALADFQSREAAQTQRQVTVERAKYRNIPFAPGNIAGKDVDQATTQDALGNPIDRVNGNYRTRVINGDREYMPVSAAPKIATPAQQGSFADFIKTREQEAGGKKLTSKEVLSALTEYQRAKGTMTPGEKLAMAKQLADYRAQIGTPEAEDIANLAQTVTIGARSTHYFDVSTSKDKAKAQRDAIRQGIIPVNSKQADQLASASGASQNLHGFLDQIKSKLPAEAKDRPIQGIENVVLGQLYQGDPELASATAWDTTVVPLLRGLSDTGRLSNVHMQMAFAARPKITDTVGTAAKKVDILDTVLANAASQILTRGVGGATGGDKTAGADTARRVAARKFLLANHKQTDDATITTFLKNNPTFK